MLAKPKIAAQQGAALLVLLLFITLAFASLIVSSLSPGLLRAKQMQQSLSQLAQAKQALLDWSVVQGDLGSDTYHRPGNLPCPDTSLFGESNTGFMAGTCSSGGDTNIGRLPWKSLGIPLSKDASGEPLWLVISDGVRRAGLNNQAINSDTVGSLPLFASDGQTLLSTPGNELVALIMSPNTPLTGQLRSSNTQLPADYLEHFRIFHNENAQGPYIAGPVLNLAELQGEPLVNDLVIGITAQELIHAIEKRALSAAQTALAAYALDHAAKYPNPALPNESSCLQPITDIHNPSTCTGSTATCAGRLPEDQLSGYLPPWFLQNGWGRTMIYLVNKNDAVDVSGSHCASNLSVDGNIKRYVLIAPGTALPDQTRPSIALSDYLEGNINAGAWTGTSALVTPPNNSNDQLRSIP